MALGASHPLMKTAQGKASLVVIELGDGANRLPTGGSVAVLARDVQVSMWTAGNRVASGLAKARTNTTGQDQEQRNHEKGCRRE